MSELNQLNFSALFSKKIYALSLCHDNGRSKFEKNIKLKKALGLICVTRI